jgi:hypothetical protein
VKFGDLVDHLLCIRASVIDGEIEGCTEAELNAMDVVVRVQDRDGDTHLGNLSGVDVDAGCTDVEVLMLDATQEPQEATLGPANDAPADVAAQAAMSAEAYASYIAERIAAGAWPSTAMSSGAYAGWTAREFDHDPLARWTFREWAGWLAFEIVHHDEFQRG